MTEFEQRRRTVSDQLAAHKTEGLIVSSPANIRYLTGYAGSNGLILITRSEEHFFTDPRYGAEAQAQITCKVHVAKGPLPKAVAGIIKRKKLRKVGYEPAWMRIDVFDLLKAAVPKDAKLEAAGGIVEELRAVKSAEEIAKIRRSVRVNSEAFARTMNRVKPGVREHEIAAELDFQMRILGSEKPAFDTIVAAGPRSALPHSHPSSHPLGENELLLIDMGSTVEGYTSDMTRVAHLGPVPQKTRQLYKAVAEAQQAALDIVRAGIPASKVDATARAVLKKYDLDKQFLHATGHGLGLEIHEAPRLGRKEKMRLKAGMVITVEPGAYLNGYAGVRIEDTVLVTERGCQVLTPTPKKLFNL